MSVVLRTEYEVLRT